MLDQSFEILHERLACGRSQPCPLHGLPGTCLAHVAKFPSHMGNASCPLFIRSRCASGDQKEPNSLQMMESWVAKVLVSGPPPLWSLRGPGGVARQAWLSLSVCLGCALHP